MRDFSEPRSADVCFPSCLYLREDYAFADVGICGGGGKLV